MSINPSNSTERAIIRRYTVSERLELARYYLLAYWLMFKGLFTGLKRRVGMYKPAGNAKKRD